jgi:hypothetical protein
VTTLFSNGYAIFIGVGADLPVTTNDAKALHDLFINPGRAAYSPERVKLLTEKDATRDGILTTLDTFAILLSKDPNATIMVAQIGQHFPATIPGIIEKLKYAIEDPEFDRQDSILMLSAHAYAFDGLWLLAASVAVGNRQV